MHALGKTRVLSQVQVEDRAIVFESLVEILDSLGIEVVGSEDDRAAVLIALDCAINHTHGAKTELVMRQIKLLKT